MKCIWSIETEYEALRAGENRYVLDDGEIAWIPFSGMRETDKIVFQYLPIEKRTGARIETLPPKTGVFETSQPVFYDQKTYRFGSKIVRSETIGGQIIECREAGELVWKFRHRAYLYTDIIEKNGCIIFGTDGMGSRLYCVDLQTGHTVSETKTHFSGFYDHHGFEWYNGKLVVYGKGTLALLDPFTGEFADEWKIPTRYPYRSFLRVINDYAYCCVLTKTNRATVFCVALSRAV